MSYFLKKRKKNLKGFSLLELILVLGVGSALAFIKFQDMIHDQENLKASAAGQQIAQIGDAVNGYINIRYDKLSTLANATGTGTDPGPRTCSSSTSVCTITYQTLINEGLLPTSYVAKNSFGSDYTIQLKRNGTSPNYVIDGIIATSSDWTEGGKTRYDLLGKAMQAAGIDSGMSKSASQIDGYGGGWNYTAANFSAINKAGLLGYRVGYNSAMYSVYLRRDGTLPMTGNLNMGSNDIDNAVDITASGTTTSGTLKSTGATNVGTNLTVATTGTFGGTVAVAGKSVADMPTGWSGLRTQDVVGSGTVAVGTPNGSSSTWKTYMNNSGNIYASNNISSAGTINATGRVTGGDVYSNSETYTTNWFRTLGDGGIYFQKYGGGWNMGDTATINAYGGKNIQTTAGLYGSYVQSSGNMYAAGSVQVNGNVTSSSQIVANSRLTTNELLQINGVVGEGNGCSPNGLIGRTGTGKIVSCTNGVWSGASGSPVIRTASASAYRFPGAVAYCSGSEKVVGGGGQCTTAEGYIWLTTSRPNGDNSWYAVCDTTKSITAYITVYAICQQ